MRSTRDSALRFLVVGALTVAIDLVFYRLTMFTGLSTGAAKATGFIVGTLFAYVANRTWTFSAKGSASFREIAKFGAVYGGSLVTNVAVNGLILGLLGKGEAALIVAFLVATAVSAMLNFLGMKFLVFQSAVA